MHRRDFTALLDSWLQPPGSKWNDVAENGLQVEGRDDVKRVICGVSATLELIEKAAAAKADAICVHHGIVWSGGIRRIDGWLRKRVGALVESGINLYGYHLPLDAQPEFGNNAGIARALGLVDVTPFGRYKGQLIGLKGRLPAPLSRAQLGDVVRNAIGPPLVLFGVRDVSTIGICTGGAPELLHDAIADGLDGYLTGEVTEWVKAVAEESGTVFVAAGHHATERFGPRGLAEKLRSVGLDATFVDVENPA